MTITQCHYRHSPRREGARERRELTGREERTGLEGRKKGEEFEDSRVI